MATRSSKKRAKNAKSPATPETLKGWQQIASFLGQPVNVAQRWAKTGMPVTRQGRNVIATPEEMNKWLDINCGEADSAGAGLPASWMNSRPAKTTKGN